MSVSTLKESQFRKHLQARGLKTEDIDLTLSMAKEFQEYLEKNGTSIESGGLGTLEEYISILMKEGRNSFANLIAIAR
ncbi:MAG: hypothetical protein JSV64_03810, partial [Candidatus Bathyarchaeota archaeon]